MRRVRGRNWDHPRIPREKTCREWIGMGLVLGGVTIGALFTISLFVFDEGISLLAADTIKALAHELVVTNGKLLTAERHLADRLLTGDDFMNFMDIDHGGQRLRIIIPKGDDEAERFAHSLEQMLGRHGLRWIVSVDEVDEENLEMGIIPPGIFGPFGGDKNNPFEMGAKSSLAQALEDLNFCIHPRFVPPLGSDLANEPPAVISLLIGVKDRRAPDCK